jgi:methionine biosynthesis protein MetW
MTEKATMEALARLVPEGSRVLDLGCGDGSMLDYLQRSRGCSGYGIEIADANVLACVRRGVNVIQLNLDEGLAMFGDNSFDVVLQIDTLQHLRNAEVMLRETARVGRTGIVAFPNFAHWPNRLSVLRGRMPVTRRLPYQWYDTPNIRVGTYKDFEVLALQKPAADDRFVRPAERARGPLVSQRTGGHGGVSFRARLSATTGQILTGFFAI